MSMYSMENYFCYIKIIKEKNGKSVKKMGQVQDRHLK